MPFTDFNLEPVNMAVTFASVKISKKWHTHSIKTLLRENSTPV